MFQRTLIKLLLVLPAFLIAFQASAHPGGHAELTMAQIISHMFASPYHFGVIGCSIVLAVLFTLKAIKPKTKQADTPKKTNR